MMVSGLFTHRRSIYYLVLLFFLPIAANTESIDPTGEIAWKQFETKYTIVQYQAQASLIEFNNSMNYGKSGWSFSQLFSGGEADGLTDEVKVKVDELYERVRDILDMRRQIKKVTINLYANRNQLDDAYKRIYRKDNNIRAWYIYEYKTIYINLADLHEGMLAHEMAHHIIDHFLLVRPPTATAEILARYVDSHLHKK